jgi:hypothetical protein
MYACPRAFRVPSEFKRAVDSVSIMCRLDMSKSKLLTELVNTIVALMVKRVDLVKHFGQLTAYTYLKGEPGIALNIGSRI